MCRSLSCGEGCNAPVDPTIVGRFVYHCHAVDHEDKGMMGVVEVVT
ncbi:multicopper oxidase domain-containing protein [Bradyrhizobium ivorense]|nr:multicopper oxidase domain-containing protein [Bradyrhizobium ivorense]